MTLLLDAGALIAAERNDVVVRAMLRHAHAARLPVKTTTAVVAQVWRAPARQAVLVRLLRFVEEVELTRPRARALGALLAAAGTSDVVDASLVELAVNGDEVLTSDPEDLARLADCAEKTLIITPV